MIEIPKAIHNVKLAVRELWVEVYGTTLRRGLQLSDRNALLGYLPDRTTNQAMRQSRGTEILHGFRLHQGRVSPAKRSSKSAPRRSGGDSQKTTIIRDQATGLWAEVRVSDIPTIVLVTNLAIRTHGSDAKNYIRRLDRLPLPPKKHAKPNR